MALIVKHYFILKIRFRIFFFLGSTDFTLTINQTGAKNSISEVQIKSLPKDGLNLRGFAAIGRGRSRIEFHELNLSRGPGSSTETLARQGEARGEYWLGFKSRDLTLSEISRVSSLGSYWPSIQYPFFPLTLHSQIWFLIDFDQNVLAR